MDGTFYTAPIYDRALLEAGNVVEGPAIVIEMDSTTLVLPEYSGEVDAFGNILIRPITR
jgi:N-methylhydantoinase A